ncbi:MAG: entericidin A/B family lipoprotein [Deltaproteobacteria bacterium]|nr:entericidin A/B family lipoprotein [Deltaproteobacteria bacterium]
MAIAILTIAISAIGCNTLEGAGKDLEKAGENIQDAAD